MPTGVEWNALLDLALRLGPWFLLPLAWAETAAVTGLLVPAGVGLALAAFLSTLGYMPLPVVVLAAGLGAALGDQTGYWIGRRGHVRLSGRQGRLGALVRRTEESSRPFFRGYPLVGVTLARAVSFVRTLMPPMAGMSGIRWAPFTLFDLAGVGLWLLLYVSAGRLAGVAWEPVTHALGVGSLLLFVLVVMALLVWRRVRAPEPSPHISSSPLRRTHTERGEP